MATPATLRSQNNLIINALTELLQTVVSDVQGTTRTGRITLTNGNTAVVGVDTSFLADVAAGEYIAIRPDRYGYSAFGLVDTVVNDNSITLDANYTGDTVEGLYVVLTKDEYLHAVEYPSVVDLRVYDPLKEFEPNTPNCEFWFYEEEIQDHAENAIGLVGLSIIVHRPTFRLMQQESQELIFDIERWLNVHHSYKALWDYIQYTGFSNPIIYTDKEQQHEVLATTYYFHVAFLRQAY